MNKLFIIIRREYWVRVSKKSFLIMTFLTPIIFVGLMAGVAWLTASKTFREDKTVVVLDQSGIFAEKLKPMDEITFRLVKGEYKSIKEEFEKGEDFAFLHIPKLDIDKPDGIELIGRKDISMITQTDIHNLLSNILEKERLIKSGVDPATLDQAEIEMSTHTLGSESDTGLKSFLIYIVGFLAAFMIYMAVLLYGSQVMRSVVEEKTNRIIEVIISSVKPFPLMLGKIIGVGLVGLTQFSLWGILSVILYSVVGVYIGPSVPADGAAGANMDDNKVMEILSQLHLINFPLIIACFMFYFLFGYLLYAAMYAAVGAAGDSETDAAQFTLPITMPLIMAFALSQAAINDPDGPLAFWTSIFPFTSPIVMMARIPYGVPAWQIILSMLLLAGSFFVVVFLAARIYRVGLLMYGKKPSFKDLWKWLFIKN